MNYSQGGGGSTTESLQYSGKTKDITLSTRNKKHTIFYKSFFIGNAFGRLYKFKAFTLAEVLITLGIIGIVAAMTLPTLIANYQKKQTISQLKAAYSILQQAVKMSEVDNGDVLYWNYSINSVEFFEKYLKNYLKFQSTTKNNTGIKKDIPYRWINNQPIGSGFKEENSNTYLGTLTNGCILYLYTRKGYTPTIMIDINGYKRPNKVGIDFFHFALHPEHGLTPFGYDRISTSTEENEGNDTFFGATYDRNKLMGNSRFACNKNSFGRWCTALIITDGWEIKPDYPWDIR